MKLRGFIYLIAVSFIISSCEKKSPYKGYSPTNTGLHYKIISLGDGLAVPHPGDFLQLSITYKTINDSIFLDTYTYNETGKVILPYTQSSFIGSFEEGIAKMHAGDTYSFIVNADSLFSKFFKTSLPVFLKSNDFVKMDITLHKILDKKSYKEELELFSAKREKNEESEEQQLKEYLDSCSVEYTSLANEIHYTVTRKGAGNRIKRGDIITIHYRGCFLNGVPFESSYQQGQPMQFTYGQEGQIIKGLEKGISLMNEGMKAKFIIPSQLAFGSTGSSSGIIPPYTTVIYEVELLNCKRSDSN